MGKGREGMKEWGRKIQRSVCLCFPFRLHSWREGKDRGEFVVNRPQCSKIIELWAQNQVHQQLYFISRMH